MGIEIDLQSSLFVLSTKNPSALPFSFLRLNKITHIEIPPAQVSHMAEYGWSTIVSEVMEWMGLSDDDRVHWHRDALDWICFVHLQGKCDFESIEKAIKIVLDAACVKLLLGVQQVDLTVDNVKSLLIPDMTFSTLWNDTRVGSAVFIGDDGLLHSLQIMLTDGDGVLSNSKDTVDPIIGVEFAKNWLRAHSSRFSKPDTKVLVQSSGQSDNGCMATAAAVALVSGTMNVQVSEKTVIICGLKLSGRLASPSSSQEIVMQRVIQAIDFGAKQIILSREEISQRVWESVPSGLKKDATVVFLDSFESLVKHMFGN
ncbi:hypothetical protein BCR33DRAFT_206386 [Rhizoclosmatium globosum]|uniref:Lon proteolytic domain-containing protein n=1 Tax=Rhizoclosmatium globosum TaxID=329046 RepID=A0A1Y2CCA9_9FUNG|nr:hypothetical protein BCR33DRAFT_206386 [Rhizoclosmatium globosum]|eukprot:ORY44669.1 hypothetical protein BCR33DRAFT_206386 [Rhizoclosmatium globosum]